MPCAGQGPGGRRGAGKLDGKGPACSGEAAGGGGRGPCLGAGRPEGGRALLVSSACPLETGHKMGKPASLTERPPSEAAAAAETVACPPPRAGCRRGRVVMSGQAVVRLYNKAGRGE